MYENNINNETKPTESAILVNGGFRKDALISNQSISNELNLQPKKSKIWLGILIFIIIGVLVGGYWYYFTQILSGKYFLNNFAKGPNLQIYQTDILNFGTSEYLNAIIYQKKDKNIYGDFDEFDTNSFKVLETYGGNLDSLSPNNKYAVISYNDTPSILDSDSDEIKKIKDNLKDAKGRSYLVDMELNTFYNLGENIGKVLWSKNKLFLIRGTKELLTYDFYLANYSPPVYQGPIEPYYKIIDLGEEYNINYFDILPNSDLIYLISTNTSTDKSALYSFDASKKQYTKILDTKSNAFSFSPSGKYIIFYDSLDKLNTICETDKYSVIAEIKNEHISPYKSIWSEEEDFIYFFSLENEYFDKVTPGLRQKGGFIGIYANLVKYNILSKQLSVIIKGTQNNLASPINLETNIQKNMIYFSTMQNNNIYMVDIK